MATSSVVVMKKPDRTVPELPVDWREQDVFGLDDGGVLGFVIEQRRLQDAAAAAELRGVTAWADRHRVAHPEADGHGSVDPDVDHLCADEVLARAKAGDGWSFAGPDGIEGLLRLCGQNTYLVTEFAVAELAAALRMSEAGARRLTGQALEVRDRLPRIWSRVMSGELPAWKARRIAEQTIPLADETASWIDARLEAFVHKLSLHRVEQCVAAAVLRFEPERAAEEAREAADRRGVWTEDHLDGTSTVTARTGTPDAAAFDRAVGGIASSLAALGDTDELDVRRAKAVGVIADPQEVLDLHAEAERASEQPSEQPAEDRRARGAGAGPTFHLHVHVSLGDSAVRGRASDAPVGPVVRVDGPGVHDPLPLAAVEQWLRDLAPGATVKVTPVVDLTTTISADGYEVPVRIADQVEERDLGCQFPWCGRRGRHDKDHIVEYVPLDEGGPPGQTNTRNLSRLCRFHHRVKTHSSWSYRREPDGSLTWQSPHGLRYRVDPSGTTNL